MTKRLELHEIQKELDRIAGILRFDTERSGDRRVHLQEAVHRLSGMENDLQRNMEIAFENLNTLKNTASGHLREAEQAAKAQVDQIKRLLEAVKAALNECHRLGVSNRGEPEDRVCGTYDAIQKTHYPVPSLELTKQTIQLLDRQRYGTADTRAETVEYPVPDLGFATHQRDCGMAEKICMGSGSVIAKSLQDRLSSRLPRFYSTFSREGDWTD